MTDEHESLRAYGLDDDTIGGAVVIFLVIVAIAGAVGFLLGWWIT